MFCIAVKVEADDSDSLAALTDFKEEDLKQFDDACNDFSNGKNEHWDGFGYIRGVPVPRYWNPEN